MSPDRPWQAVHLAVDTAADRRALLTGDLAEPEASDWFVADGVEDGIVELARRGDPRSRLTATGRARVRGDSHPPCVLRVLGVVPATSDAYGSTLADHSRRAVVALRECAHDVVSDEAAAVELARLYEDAAPQVDERLVLLRAHRDWLDRVRTGRRATPVPDRDAGDPMNAPAVRGAFAALASASARDGGAGSYGALVARLAHTQMVRLRGPERDNQLDWERTAVDALVVSLATSST